MKTYQNVLFAPDGEYVTDNERTTVDGVWRACNDMGSRWIFYPIAVVVRGGHVTQNTRIIDAGEGFEQLKGKSIKTAQRLLRENVDGVCAYFNPVTTYTASPLA